MANVFGWFALQQSAPSNPVQIINYASIVNGVNTETGRYSDTTTYAAGTGGSWGTTPISITSEPTIVSIRSEPEFLMAANRGNLVLLSANTDTTLAVPLRTLVYLVGNPAGKTDWQMNIPITFGGSNYTQLQLSMLENAGTRGDSSGNYPVILFDGNSAAFMYTGTATLKLVLNGAGEYRFGLRAESSTNVSSMFEIHCILIPMPM